MSFRGHRPQESIGGGSWALPPLSVTNTLALHAGFALQGAQDALKLHLAGQKVASDKVIQANVLKSTVLQAILLTSALVIKPILRRAVGLRATDSVTSSIFYLGFHVLWLWPLAGASTYYSGLLRATSETDKRGMGRQNQAADRGLTAKLVSESYRTLVTVNYFVFFYALRLIPSLGAPLSFLYASVVDAYYCFEGHWVRNGWPFGERVRHIEQRWAYAFGFGFPITFLSWWSSDPVVNLAIFALLYPLFQLTSTVSMPQPLDPSHPSTSSTAPSFLHSATGVGHGSFSIAAAEGGSENQGRKGSALVPTRVRVLLLAEGVYAALTAAFGMASSGGGRKKDAGHGHGHGGYGGGRAAAAAARERFDAGYGAYGAGAGGQDVYGGQPTGYGGAASASSQAGGDSPYGSPQKQAQYAQPNAYDPYASPAAYAGQAPVGQTPPRRGYAAAGDNQSDVYSSPAYNGGAYGAPAGGAYGAGQGQGGQGGYAPGVQPPQGGYGGGKGFEGLLRQAGARGGKKSD
ncbi:hypothetical protein JCM8097_008726 [Rhodosporidiobolus ruineniae]